MSKVRSSIDDVTRQFIEAQPMFFVATAPLDPQGHVNVSPKGLDTFRILGPDTVGYLDLTGSGVETIAHVRENARIVLMFCAFQGPPNILRIHGRGRVVEHVEPQFAALTEQFDLIPGARAIILVEQLRISDSCGTAVPLLRHEADRHQLEAWARKKGPEEMKKYRQQKNQQSLDGLPGITS